MFVAQDTISEMCELITVGKPQLHEKNAKIQEKNLHIKLPFLPKQQYDAILV